MECRSFLGTWKGRQELDAARSAVREIRRRLLMDERRSGSGDDDDDDDDDIRGERTLG